MRLSRDHKPALRLNDHTACYGCVISPCGTGAGGILPQNQRLEVDNMSATDTRIYSNGMSELEDFIRRKRITNRSPRTLSEYSRIVSRFFEWAGHRNPDKITERDIERYLEHMQDRKLSQNSQAKYIEALASFFSFLHGRPEYSLKFNPAADLASEIKLKGSRAFVCNLENVRKNILSMTDPCDQAMAVLAAKAGLRISRS